MGWLVGPAHPDYEYWKAKGIPEWEVTITLTTTDGEVECEALMVEPNEADTSE